MKNYERKFVCDTTCSTGKFNFEVELIYDTTGNQFRLFASLLPFHYARDKRIKLHLTTHLEAILAKTIEIYKLG
jgi:hypothetical protein